MHKEIDQRWALSIDIEGFSALWTESSLALQSLASLMEGIHSIGEKVFPNEVDRLFAHQYGDGFFISSDFHEKSLERAATVAIALMRHVTSKHGLFAKGSVTEGETADITGCYPDFIRSRGMREDAISLGAGLMTVFPVMGTGLINAVKLSGRVRGPVLAIDKSNLHRIPPEMRLLECNSEDCLVIDWINYQSDLLSDIQTRACLNGKSPEQLKTALSTYITRPANKLPAEWIAAANRML